MQTTNFKEREKKSLLELQIEDDEEKEEQGTWRGSKSDKTWFELSAWKSQNFSSDSAHTAARFVHIVCALTFKSVVLQIVFRVHRE